MSAHMNPQSHRSPPAGNSGDSRRLRPNRPLFTRPFASDGAIPVSWREEKLIPSSQQQQTVLRPTEGPTAHVTGACDARWSTWLGHVERGAVRGGFTWRKAWRNDTLMVRVSCGARDWGRGHVVGRVRSAQVRGRVQNPPAAGRVWPDSSGLFPPSFLLLCFCQFRPG